MADQVIIIALDYSEQAETAVKWYVERMHRPGNKIVFVHCIELPEMSLNQARNFHMSPGVLASMWKDEEVKTKQLEEKMKTLLVEKGIPGVLRTATGKPGEVICRISEEESATCIITGTRGMGKVRRTILGSVSDYLIHHAHCPVVVCRSGEKKARRPSGSDGKKSRHSSGDSFTQSIRKRFGSGGKASRSQSVSSDTSDTPDPKEVDEHALLKDSQENKEP